MLASQVGGEVEVVDGVVGGEVRGGEVEVAGGDQNFEVGVFDDGTSEFVGDVE